MGVADKVGTKGSTGSALLAGAGDSGVVLHGGGPLAGVR